jgi:hypothetical protein
MSLSASNFIAKVLQPSGAYRLLLSLMRTFERQSAPDMIFKKITDLTVMNYGCED